MPPSPPPPPIPSSGVKRGRLLFGSILRKHKGKITVVVVGQLVTILGLAIGSRVLTEFVKPAALGEYKLVIGIVGFLTAIFFRPFTQFVMRHYHDAVENKEDKHFIAFARRSINTAMLLLGAVLALAFYWYSGNQGAMGLTAAGASLGLLYLHVHLSFQHGVLVTQNLQLSAVVIRTTIQCVTPLALAVGAFALGQSGEMLLLAELALLFLLFNISVLLTRKHTTSDGSSATKEQSQKWIKAATQFVVPLLSVSLFSWTLAVADRYILAAYHSPREVGLYTAVYGLGSQPMLMMCGMMSQLIFPILFKAAAQEKMETQRRALRYSLWSAITTSILSMSALVILGEIIINLLLAAPYRENALPLLLWISAGYALLGTASTFELKAYAGKKTLVISLAYAIAAAVNIGMNLLLIPSNGALGAAQATFAGYFAYLVSIVFTSSKLNPEKPSSTA